jgi:hypothetical protein
MRRNDLGCIPPLPGFGHVASADIGAVSDLGHRDRGFVGDAGQYLGHVRTALDQRYPMGAPTGGDLPAVHRIVGGAFDLRFNV